MTEISLSMPQYSLISRNMKEFWRDSVRRLPTHVLDCLSLFENSHAKFGNRHCLSEIHPQLSIQEK